MTPSPQLLWNPEPNAKSTTNLYHYMCWLSDAKNLHFDNYDQLWTWSIENTRDFWQSIFEYFKVRSHTPYTTVHSDDPMPDTKWFSGATLNYAEHIFSQQSENPAIIFENERGVYQEISWKDLEKQVAVLATYLKSIGVGVGDRVVAFMPNIPAATVGFLASGSIGAVWSSCSPDFGATSVVDRFRQIGPKVLLTVDGYFYGNKPFDKLSTVKDIVSRLPSLEKVILVPYLDPASTLVNSVLWGELMQKEPSPLKFEPVPFDHPIWVLYSSGTTGQPKAITHSQGGTLLEHLKYVAFHNDVKPGERYFWYTTTGWMMWNFVQATLLCGATIILYDGSPAYPDLRRLWKLADDHSITHFGTSAPFIIACMKAGLRPGTEFGLKQLRSISSTGSPLPPDGFDWIYQQVKNDVWLVSMSGGTDVCSAFVGGCPLEPVYEGEIQRRALGCSMYAFDEGGHPVTDEVGEMVVTRPMPSMPVFFWNDPGKIRYKESYFSMYPGIWRHGDWLVVTERNSLIIKGRSDATLNRHGIRIGTAEIYQSVGKVAQVKDSLVVNIELPDGNHFMPIFLVMNFGTMLTEEVKNLIAGQLKTDFTPRHVPDDFVVVPEIPLTISGKKMEAPVKKILMGQSAEKAANLGAMRNPESLEFFVNYAATLTAKK